MKRIGLFFVVFLLILNISNPVQADGGVPENVMDAAKSVVRILSEGYSGSSTGSGFVIQNKPGEVLIATNDHVVSGSPYSISIWIGEEDLVSAEIVFTVPDKDLCVLKVKDKMDMNALTLSAGDARQGEEVYAVGFPGVGDVLSDTAAHTSDEATITDGIISAIRTYTIEQQAEPVKLLQINAAINSGNSGGPLFNRQGEVIGINTYKVNKDSQGIFGAIAVQELRTLLEENDIVLVVDEPAEEKEEKEIPYIPPVKPKSAAILPVICLVLAGILLVVAVAVSLKGKKKKMTLQTVLQMYPQGMKASEAVALLMPVVVQLRDLHNNGKPHLQVSAGNILIGTKGAELKSPTTQEADRFSSGFAAPEIYRGSGFGVVSDIYSMAAVFCCAVTGTMPANSLHREQVEADLACLEEKDPAFSEIIRKCLSESGHERPQNMQELIYQISAFNIQSFQLPQQAQTDKGKKLTVVIAAAVSIMALVATALVAPGMIERKNAYAYGMSLLEDGSYDHAVIAFEELGDYKDSAKKILKAKYEKATMLLEAAKYDAAAEIFTELKDYSDSKDQLDLIRKEKDYLQALALLEDEDYEGAYNAFAALGDHRDADSYLNRFEIKKLKVSCTSEQDGQEEWSEFYEYDNGRRAKTTCNYTKNANVSFFGYSLSASSIPAGEKYASASAVYTYDDENDSEKVNIFGTNKNLLETRIYEYDEKGRLTREVIDKKSGSGDKTYVYAYDSNGNKTERQWYQNLTGSGTPYERRYYEYDEHGQMTRESYRYSSWYSSSGEYTYRNEYDAKDRLVKQICEQASALSLEYEYDDEDRVTVKRKIRNAQKGGYQEGTVEAEYIYAYDSEGNMIKEILRYPASDEEHIYTYQYSEIYTFK